MNKIVMILACGLSNFLSRVIPQFLTVLEHLPKKLRKAMILLPVAALGSLIFPLALTDFSSQWYAGLGGIVIAFILGYKRRSMIVSILFALIATTLLLLI